MIDSSGGTPSPPITGWPLTGVVAGDDTINQHNSGPSHETTWATLIAQTKNTLAAEEANTKSTTCIPKNPKKTLIELLAHRVNGRIKFMMDHALIGKFMGFWPMEKAL